MRYADLDRVTRGIPIQTLIWLSNDDPQAATVDAAVVEEIVKEQEDRADDRLRGRYALPLLEPSPSLREAIVRLSKEALYARRPETEIPKDVVRMAKEALADLEAMRDRQLSPGVESTHLAQPEPGAFHIRAPARALGDDALSRY
jgi:phage gp36-like protein